MGLANVSSVYPEASLNDNFPNNNFLNGNGIYNQSDLDFEGSQNGAVLNNIAPEGKQKYFTETINVEISTPADFKDTYYEIATIKKPFTFQVRTHSERGIFFCSIQVISMITEVFFYGIEKISKSNKFLQFWNG